jgi:hypothetical protein
MIILFAALDVDATFRLYYSNVLQIVAPFLTTTFCYRAAANFPTGSPMRKVWSLLGSGVLAWGLGAILFISYPLLNAGQETPYPYYSDLGYLSFVPLVVTALLLFKSNLGVAAPMWGKMLAVILFGLGLIISVSANWDGFLKDDFILKIVSAAYMLFDPFLLMVSVLLASGLYGGMASATWWYLLGGLAFYFIGDQLYTYLVMTKQYASGSPIDTFWLIGFLMITVAAISAYNLFRGSR